MFLFSSTDVFLLKRRFLQIPAGASVPSVSSAAATSSAAPAGSSGVSNPTTTTGSSPATTSKTSGDTARFSVGLGVMMGAILVPRLLVSL